jgi:hypothetical protein
MACQAHSNPASAKCPCNKDRAKLPAGTRSCPGKTCWPGAQNFQKLADPGHHAQLADRNTSQRSPTFSRKTCEGVSFQSSLYSVIAPGAYRRGAAKTDVVLDCYSSKDPRAQLGRGQRVYKRECSRDRDGASLKWPENRRYVPSGCPTARSGPSALN